jgi:hypothetical protein
MFVVACASNQPADSGGGSNTAQQKEQVCHWETGARFGSRDRRVCRDVDVDAT